MLTWMSTGRAAEVVEAGPKGLVGKGLIGKGLVGKGMGWQAGGADRRDRPESPGWRDRARQGLRVDRAKIAAMIAATQRFGSR